MELFSANLGINMNKIFHFIQKNNGFSLIEAMISTLLITSLALSAAAVFINSEDGRILGNQNTEINNKTRKIRLLLEDHASCVSSLQGIGSGVAITLSGEVTDTEGNSTTNRLITDIYNGSPDTVYYSAIDSILLEQESLKIRDDLFAKVMTITFNRINGPLKGQKALRQLTVSVELNDDGTVANCQSPNTAQAFAICNFVGATVLNQDGNHTCQSLNPIGQFSASTLTASEGNIGDPGIIVLENIEVNGDINVIHPLRVISASDTFTIDGDLETETILATRVETQDFISQNNTVCLGPTNNTCRKFNVESCPDGTFASGIRADGSLECQSIPPP